MTLSNVPFAACQLQSIWSAKRLYSYVYMRLVHQMNSSKGGAAQSIVAVDYSALKSATSCGLRQPGSDVHIQDSTKPFSCMRYDQLSWPAVKE